MKNIGQEEKNVSKEIKNVSGKIDGACQENASAVQTAIEKGGVSCKKMQKISLSWRAYDYLCIRLAAARQFHNVGCTRHSPNKFGSALICTPFQVNFIS